MTITIFFKYIWKGTVTQKISNFPCSFPYDCIKTKCSQMRSDNSNFLPSKITSFDLFHSFKVVFILQELL